MNVRRGAPVELVAIEVTATCADDDDRDADTLPPRALDHARPSSSASIRSSTHERRRPSTIKTFGTTRIVCTSRRRMGSGLSKIRSPDSERVRPPRGSGRIARMAHFPEDTA